MQSGGWTGIDSIIIKSAALVAALTGICVAVGRSYRLARKAWRTVTAFAQSGEQILLLQERLAVVVETLPEPIIRLDHNGHYLSGNSAFLRLVGMSDSEAASTGWQSAIHPDDRERFLEIWRTSIQRRARFTVSIRVRNASETIQVNARFFPLMGQEGEVLENKLVLRVIERHPITGSGMSKG